MGVKNCIFLDIPDQQIVYKEISDPSFVEIVHDDGWIIRIPLKEINQIKAANTTASLLSPYTYLYYKHKEKGVNDALWILAAEDYIFLATFSDGKIIFAKAYRLDDRELKETIEEFLREFYELGDSYFIERVFIYYVEDSFFKDPDLEDKILLPVEFEKVDLEKVCQNPHLSRYFATYKDNEVRIGINRKFILATGLTILTGLILYDLYLRYSNFTFKNKIDKAIKRQVEVANLNNRLQSKIMKLNLIKPVSMEIGDNNQLISSKLKDLFEIVPDDIYFTYLNLLKDGLVIKGYTKNRASFLEHIHSKLSRFYQESSFKLKKEGKKFYFEARYKELEND